MLTDRDERALLTAGENRISEPLRIGAALAAVRRVLAGARTRTGPAGAPARGDAPPQERESVPCHPTSRPAHRTPPRPDPARP
ncbi:hypothetical protein [Streptomyces sp. NPDC058701]|uniref:hypothetical protein n=1 Tax=Streptomyces sp. NPDC058701 TaxID=3346608 RepID=UPI0036535F07